MKKYIFGALFSLIPITFMSFITPNNCYGNWEIEETTYTFTNDSLFIMDYGYDEGECYKIEYKDSIIHATNEIWGVEFDLIVHDVNDSTICLQYSDYDCSYTLKRND